MLDCMCHYPEEAAERQPNIPMRFKLRLEQVEITVLEQHHDLLRRVHRVFVSHQPRIALKVLDDLL